MKTRTVLLAGFEPFAGDTVNPSAELARALGGRVVAGHMVIGAILPCVFATARHEIARLVRLHQPAAVIGIGLAGGRAEITPERVAINVTDARIPDNAGAQPIDLPVVRGGPAAYWTRLPIKAIVAALRERSIPAAVSETAGTFVCNHVFYGLMHALRWQRAIRGGFIHVPYLPEQAPRGQPSLSREMMIEAIEIAIESTLTTRVARREAGGRTR
jgi:pyroglutamyl-peptidase